MAWSLLHLSTYTASADYKNRVGIAFLQSANNILNEDPATQNHANRVSLANQVISGTGVPPRCFQLLPVLNPGLQVEGDPTDSDILFTVAQQWDYFAPTLPAS